MTATWAVILEYVKRRSLPSAPKTHAPLPIFRDIQRHRTVCCAYIEAPNGTLATTLGAPGSDGVMIEPPPLPRDLPELR